MRQKNLIHQVRELPFAQRAKLARVLRKAISIAEIQKRLPAWTITIQLMGKDIGPEDDEVSIPKKLNWAANRLTTMTGAKYLSWVWSPKPTFSFRIPSPEDENLYMGVQIRLENDRYNLKVYTLPGMGGSSEILKMIRGVDAEDLKRTFERETKLYLSFR